MSSIANKQRWGLPWTVNLFILQFGDLWASLTSLPSEPSSREASMLKINVENFSLRHQNVVKNKCSVVGLYLPFAIVPFKIKQESILLLCVLFISCRVHYVWLTLHGTRQQRTPFQFGHRQIFHVLVHQRSHNNVKYNSQNQVYNLPLTSSWQKIYRTPKFWGTMKVLASTIYVQSIYLMAVPKNE